MSSTAGLMKWWLKECLPVGWSELPGEDPCGKGMCPSWRRCSAVPSVAKWLRRTQYRLGFGERGMGVTAIMGNPKCPTMAPCPPSARVGHDSEAPSRGGSP